MEKKFMELAIRLAQKAGVQGEIPVGAVIVRNGEVVATGENHREKRQNALSHAELEAISSACEALKSWRLDDCELYVTLEPCPMCAGAIINARIKTVIFGAYDSAAGSFGSLTDLSTAGYPWKPEIYGGICEDKCKLLLTGFFKGLRKNDEKH